METNLQMKGTGVSRALLIGGMVLYGAVVAYTVGATVNGRALAKNNLFALVGELNGTTSAMLQHTQALSSQVTDVQNQLQALQKQESILQSQEKTGTVLAKSLNRQETLTQQNVDLMQQILAAEQQTAPVAAVLAQKSQALQSAIGQNAQVLSGLNGSLLGASQGSTRLSAEMGPLLSELANAKQEFRSFGQVNQLLKSVGLPNATDGLLSGLASATSGPLSGLANATSGNGSGQSGILGGLLGTK